MNKKEDSNRTTSLDDLWDDHKSAGSKSNQTKSDPLESVIIVEPKELVTKTASEQPEEQLTTKTPEELLKKLPFNIFIENVHLSVRTYNSIMVGLEREAIKFMSIGDYWYSDQEDQNLLLKLDGFGKGSKTDLDDSIQKLIRNPGKLKALVEQDSSQSDVSIEPTDKASGLDTVSFQTFIDTVDLSVRTYNCLSHALQGDDLLDFQTVGEYFVASNAKKLRILNLPNFGKGSKVDLDNAIALVLETPTLMSKLLVDGDASVEASDSDIPNSPQLLSGISNRLADAISERQLAVLRKRLIDGRTLEQAGKDLGVTRERIRQIAADAFKKINKLFNQETVFVVGKLESLLMEAGGVMSFDDCVKAFPEINEFEFAVLFATYERNPTGTLEREKGHIWDQGILAIREELDEKVLEAFLASYWPVQISNITSRLPDIPRPYIEYFLKRKFKATISDGKIVSAKKLKKTDQLTFVLRNCTPSAPVGQFSLIA